jgi:hypothetical protein
MHPISKVALPWRLLLLKHLLKILVQLPPALHRAAHRVLVTNAI